MLMLEGRVKIFLGQSAKTKNVCQAVFTAKLPNVISAERNTPMMRCIFEYLFA